MSMIRSRPPKDGLFVVSGEGEKRNENRVTASRGEKSKKTDAGLSQKLVKKTRIGSLEYASKVNSSICINVY